MKTRKQAAVALWILVSCLYLAPALVRAQLVPAPTAPAQSTGYYTVSYPPCAGCLTHGLYERAPGSFNWTYVGETEVSFTARPAGTYRYQVRYVYVSMRYAYTLTGPEITVEVSPTAPPDLTPPPIAAQVGLRFELRGGDIDGNGRRDLLVRRSDGASPSDGTLGAVLLRQSSAGTLAVGVPSPSELTQAAGWPLAGVNAAVRDVNVDGFADLLLTGVSRQPGYEAVTDQILFAPGRADGTPPKLAAVDAKLARFARDLRPHMIDPDYFPNSAPLRYAVIVHYYYSCSYLGYPYWSDIGYFWPCYPSVDYYYVVYRDYSVFDPDAIEVAYHDYGIIHGYQSAQAGLDAIDGVLERVLGVGVGGLDVGPLAGTSDDATRRGIELFGALGGITQAAAQENDDPAAAAANGSLTDRVLLMGRRVIGFGPFHTVLQYGVTTASAYDDDPRSLFDGTLVSQVNWPNDHPMLTMPLGAVDGPSSASVYWSSILTADGHYGDHLRYDTFPSLGAGGYNSNSYIAGIIQVTGGLSTVPMTQFVGGERPVPPGEFR